MEAEWKRRSLTCYPAPLSGAAVVELLTTGSSETSRRCQSLFRCCWRFIVMDGDGSFAVVASAAVFNWVARNTWVFFLLCLRSVMDKGHTVHVLLAPVIKINSRLQSLLYQTFIPGYFLQNIHWNDMRRQYFSNWKELQKNPEPANINSYNKAKIK